MHDFSSEQFQNSLANTIRWCKMKAIGMNADSDDIRQRQARYTQAEQNWEEAQQTVKQGWLHRKITDTNVFLRGKPDERAHRGFVRFA